MTNHRATLSKMILFLIIAIPVFAKDVILVCPYAGPLTDEYRNDAKNLVLKDTAPLMGIFFQWVRPDRWQWNAFLYRSDDINYSTLWGGHFVYDRYLAASKRGKWVIGGGAEFLRIDMDAGTHISPRFDFKLLNKLFIPYARFGYRFQFNPSMMTAGVMPWIGAEHQGVKGEMTIDPIGDTPAKTESIDNGEMLAMAGLNVSANFFHLLDVEAKYQGAFNSDTKYTSASAMANLYLKRWCALSYRYKYMELDNGYNSYHIFGLAFIL
jgi:hypothetical protein